MNPLAADGPRDCTFRAAVRLGVWSVTRNDAFYGEYLSRADALRAACSGARSAEALGANVRVLAPPRDTIIPHSNLRGTG